MISLEQVLLLQQKAQAAIQKISQLKDENAQLKSKCAELQKQLDSTNETLNQKTKELGAFYADQSKIESGIISALDRLNAVENYVLQDKADNSALQSVVKSITPDEENSNIGNSIDNKNDTENVAIKDSDESNNLSADNKVDSSKGVVVDNTASKAVSEEREIAFSNDTNVNGDTQGNVSSSLGSTKNNAEIKGEDTANMFDIF